MNRNDKPLWALHGPGQTGADEGHWRTPPEAEALLVATLALMTGIVERAALTQPLADHGQSLLMATKVRAHLHGLSSQPQMSEGFRSTLARLREHWDRLAGATSPGAADTQPAPDTSRLLWFAAPQRLQ